MERIYFDNAATTALDPVVAEAMIDVMQHHYGNPSSIHSHGRQARTLIEKARKTIASLLNTAPANIFFTSGGTEADNMAIVSAIKTLGLTHAITTKIEHHAVLHTLEELQNQGIIALSFVNIDAKGNIDLCHLEELLSSNSKSLVSIMHANNEIATLSDLEEISRICETYKAIFHCDTVQTMGHYKHNLANLNVHLLVCAAHKLHGPKGVGFLYIHPSLKIKPMLHGGAQERNMRGGTENIYGIVGLAKALEIAYQDIENHQQYIQSIKTYMMSALIENIKGISFNGETEPHKSLYTVLNVTFPATDMADMLLFNLDINGISVSGGSACSSGTNIGSHVLNQLNAHQDKSDCPAIRFSFSKYNTVNEVDIVIEKLKEYFK